MAPFLHTLSRPYDVYLMWTYWPWLGLGESWSRAESVTTQPFFKYFPIKPTWHHNSSPSCLCSCIFLHDESIQSIQSLTPERRQASNPESNPFVVGSGGTFFVHAESTLYLSPLNISCTNKANGTGQQDRPRHRSHSENCSEVDGLVKGRSDCWLGMTIPLSSLALPGGFHAKRWV